MTLIIFRSTIHGIPSHLKRKLTKLEKRQRTRKLHGIPLLVGRLA